MEPSSRTPWLAVVLGLLIPGLGHIYNRQFWRGLFFNLLGWGAGWMTLLVVGGVVVAPLNLVLALPWIPCFYFWMSRDALRAARRPSPHARDVRHPVLPYLAFLSLLLVSIPLVWTWFYRDNPWRVVTVTGRSMERTLVDGDFVLLDRYAYRNRMPVPGDIVAFEYPADRKKLFLQRCIAIEGQTVTIDDGVVYVDGIPFDEPEGVSPWHKPQDFGPAVVPDGHFFAMGDHRLRSFDSRSWGTVPRDHLWGKLVQILVARDMDGGVRLDLTGAVPD